MKRPVVTSPKELAERVEGRVGKERIVIAIAGPPGAGKSTLATALRDRLNAGKAGMAEILEMDGYHFDDRVLKARGRLAFKGAPDTFDVAGLAHMLRRLRECGDMAVAVPVFDREIEISRAGAALIGPEVDVVIVEGNYLLLKRPPWDTLRALLDLSLMIEVERDVLRRRLISRWLGYGLDPDAARRRVEENDLPNGDCVVNESAAPDLIFRAEGAA